MQCMRNRLIGYAISSVGECATTHFVFRFTKKQVKKPNNNEIHLGAY